MPEIRMMKAINDALAEEMRRDPSVFLIGEDIGSHGGPFGLTRGLWKEFGGERVIDTPIAEAGLIGIAIGAAATGMLPVAEIMFMDFMTCCMDQVVNQAAKIQYMLGGAAAVPLVIRTPMGGGGNAGPQHSQSLESWFAHVPGLKVVMPSTPYDAKGLLIAAIRDNNPVLFIENKMMYGVKGEVPEGEYIVPIGKADIKRSGSDATVVAWSNMVPKALTAAKKIAEEGLDVEVIDLMTLSPLDVNTVVRSVQKTKRLVIAHEAVKFGGFGAEIAATVIEQAFDYLDAPIVRLGAPFCPVPFSRPLEKAYLVSESDIYNAVKGLF
jgi:pyruvate dehydrogenase E1 component beta subunit